MNQTPFRTTGRLAERIEEMRQAACGVLPNCAALDKLAELQKDIEQDYFTVVVVGEFKHGKSTFVNALLGQSIMPADVTPTTATINAIFYGEVPEVHVMKTDGESEVHPLSEGVLERYTVDATFDPDRIEYLKIFLPSELLGNRVVLIDTPGVNDMNEHRASVTHNFVPRADVILFMLNMTEPIKRTEHDFLQRHLLRKENDHLVYIANFSDRVDEEELESTIELIGRRLERLTGNPNPTVIPLSARDALRGKLTRDEELLKASGMQRAEEAIRLKLSDSGKARAKSRSRIGRLHAILTELLREIQTAKALSGESMEGLQEHLNHFGEWQAHQAKWEKQLADYIQSKEDEIVYMALKSFDHFGSKLRDETEQRILHYHGPDLKGLTESQIPLLIKLQYSQWLDSYTGSIQLLLTKLEQEVAKGLMGSFNESVQIRGDRSGKIEVDLSENPMVRSGSNPNIKAGLLVGGISSIALMLGASIFIPVIGMSGLPFLQQKMAEKQMETAKPGAASALNDHLDSIYDQTRVSIRAYIRQSTTEIKRQAAEEFARLIEGMRKSVEREITMKRQNAEQEDQVRRSLEQLQAKTEQVMNMLEEELADERRQLV
jgi:ribosome biogenesis GTPase A